MKRIALGLALALGLFLVACSSAPTEASRATSSADSAADMNGAIIAVPLGSGTTLGPYFVSQAYPWKAAADACGGDYSLTMTFELGEVTLDHIRVIAVTVVYHPTPGNIVVPTTMDVWSNLTENKRLRDELFLPRREGDSHRYVVDETYRVNADGNPLVVVDFHTEAGLPGFDTSDIVCGNLAEIALYPEGLVQQ